MCGVCWSVCAAETVKVAAILSLTGIAAQHNEPLIPFIELAVDEINADGGLLGKPVQLILLDNHSTPIGSSLAAKEAVTLDVLAVIGAHWSSHSLSMAPILQEAGIPMITISTNPQITPIGDYIFRINFVDTFQGEIMARFAYKDLNARRAAVVKNLNEDYSVMLADVFLTFFEQHGGQIVYEGGYKGKAVNFSETITSICEVQPDVVYIPGYSRDSGLFIKQAAAVGVESTFLGGDAWDEIYHYGGGALEGSYYTAVWHPEMNSPASQHLQTMFQEQFDREISNFSAPPWYDAFMLLRDAVRRAGSLQHAAIRDALAATTDFRGATGNIRFDENGTPQNKEIVILRVKDGEPVYFTTIKPQK